MRGVAEPKRGVPVPAAIDTDVDAEDKPQLQSAARLRYDAVVLPLVG
jgi:hypothetical protein